METCKGTVLLIEDNVDLNEANAQALQMAGYETYTALTLEKGRHLLMWVEPDVILLDVMLPDGSGFDFCEEIRETISAHIIFLTAKSSHENMVQGLSVGGDAYITKPFHPEEMLVKVKAAMRRRRTDKNHLLKKGTLLLDQIAMQAFDRGTSLELTPIEFSVLLLFVKHEGQILASEFIYESVWQNPAINHKNALQTAISKIRHKIEPTNYAIVTKRGYGYAFERI